MNDEIPYNPPGMDKYIREGARKNQRLLDKMTLQRKLDDALKANSILRAAMYDIIELESGQHPATVVHVRADQALTATTPDENGRLAETANAPAHRPAREEPKS